MASAGGNLNLAISCCSLPETAVQFLQGLDDDISGATTSKFAGDITHSSTATKGGKLTPLIRALDAGVTDLGVLGRADEKLTVVRDLWQALSSSLCGEGENNVSQLSWNQLISLGPENKGSNLLLFSKKVEIRIWETADGIQNKLVGKVGDVDSVCATANPLLILRPFSTPVGDESVAAVTHENLFLRIWMRLFRPSVVTGFQLATANGPLMQEPMLGVCFFIDSIDVTLCELPKDLIEDIAVLQGGALPSSYYPSIMAGQLIPDVRDALKVAMLKCPLRVVEPIFSCSVQCDQTKLGNLYAVLSKRRGDVTKEDVIEGTSMFVLSASLPVASSFGFTQELLKQTSGMAVTPQLIFSHWTTMSLDPFWKPVTQDELEELGGQTVGPNIARNFINDVRKRKGLPLEEKLVVSAEKQRNLTKMK